MLLGVGNMQETFVEHMLQLATFKWKIATFKWKILLHISGGHNKQIH